MTVMDCAADRTTRRALAAILILAAALRVLVLSVPAIAHPDEIFQYLEQAHRIAFGAGIMSWEQRYAMRGALLPLLLSLPMRFGGWLAPSGNLYLLFPKLMMAALSLCIVPAAFAIGGRMGRFHAVVAAFVAATWFELVYYGGHVLSETAATALILSAAALMIDPARRGRLLVAGALLGLAAIMRFQYLPAIATLVLLSAGLQWRARWLPLVAGGVAALAAGALADAAAGQIPFRWLVENIHQNLLLDRAADYGVSDWGGYLAMIVRNWGIWFVPAFLFVQPTLRRYRPLLWMAIVNFAFHSLIGHKEYRFILLSTTALVILGAIGSAELAKRLADRMPPRTRRVVPAALLLLWAGASASLAARPSWLPRWTAFSAGLEATGAIRTAPGICGIALYDLDFWEGGGYAYLHRKLPLYLARSPVDIGPLPPLEHSAKAFNAVLAPADVAGALPRDFSRKACFSAPGTGRGSGRAYGVRNVCLFVRPGPCAPDAAREIELQRVLDRLDI